MPKRKRQPTQTELLEAFYSASENICDAKQLLLPFLHLQTNSSRDVASIPSSNVILSSMHNLIAEICVDQMLSDPKHATDHRQEAIRHANNALQHWKHNSTAALTLAQLYRETGELTQALHLYQNVTNRTVPTPIPQPEYSDSEEEEEEEEYNWRNNFIYAPHHHHCLPVAAYNITILLSQLGKHQEAKEAILRLGCTARIAPNVWHCAYGETKINNSTPSSSPSIQIISTKNSTSTSSSPPDQIISTKKSTSTSSSPPVQVIPNAIPTLLLNTLRTSFNDKATYWKQNQYDERAGYFSWWYDVTQSPLNPVEELIQKVMLPLVDNNTIIVGAEWWIHKRPIGKNLGHALHWDCDERSLNTNGVHGIQHPIVSSVCYLSGNAMHQTTSNDTTDELKTNSAGKSNRIITEARSNNGESGTGGSVLNNDHGHKSGRTVVFNKQVNSTGLPNKCWVALPETNGTVMLFDGTLLHGVLPGRSGKKKKTKEEKEEEQDDTRLTLMVGFWTVDISRIHEGKEGGRGALKLPRVTRSTTWPNDICRGEGTSGSHSDSVVGDGGENILKENLVADPNLVQCCEPAFEEIGSSGTSSSSSNDDSGLGSGLSSLVIPSSIQQRFWVQDSNDFQRALLNVDVK
jgi:tetratricopeptide (TPR) repeat protein